jgi:hypothetical protein
LGQHGAIELRATRIHVFQPRVAQINPAIVATGQIQPAQGLPISQQCP